MCIFQNHYSTPFLRLNIGFNIMVLSLCRSSHHIHCYTWLYPSLLLHFKTCTPRSPVTHPATSITKELAMHNELTRISWLQSSTTALNAKVTQTIPAVIQRIEKQILKHTQHGLLFPAHIHRQQIPAMKKTMAATMGKIISRLPFCLQYMLCENSAPRTSTTPLNIQNIVQHHLKHFVLHAQQTIKLFAIFNIVFNTKLPINRYLDKGYLNV